MDNNNSNKKYKFLIVLVFLCMAVFGFIENFKGTLIPSIRSQFGVDYGAIGIMLLVSSFGYIFATLIGGLVADRLGKKSILMFGYILLIAAAALFYTANSFTMTVVLMLLISTGFGCMEVGVNSLGAQIFLVNSAVMMNLTHLFYGLGSTVSPKYVGTVLARNLPWNYAYAFSLVILVPSLIYLAFLRFPQTSEEDKNGKLPITQLVRNKKIWLLVGTLGFCTVAELGTANWLVNFLQEARGMSVDSSSLYMTFFFAFFMLGRLLGGMIAERLGYTKTILYFTIAGIVLIASGMLLNNRFVFLFSCVGFFVSIYFPTIMSIIMKEFRYGTSSIMGFVIAANAGINMVFNWIIGKTNDLISVSFGYLSIAIYMVLIIAFIIPLERSLTFNKNRNEAVKPEEKVSASV